MPKLYLDTSAIVKRYIQEPGTPSADAVYDEANAGTATLATSLWNIGEVLGVLDEKHRRRWLTDSQFTKTLETFASETIKLLQLKTLDVIPVLSPILTQAWRIVLEDHVYAADAIQIESTKYSRSQALITADKRLTALAAKHGLKSIETSKPAEINKILRTA